VTALFVVACGAAKLDRPAPARQLYTGHHFAYVLREVERHAADTTPAAAVRILSARHGLLDPNQVVDPYDVQICQPGSVSAAEIATQLARLTPDEVYAFLPRAYLARLRAAADLVCLLVHDVFDGAAGIGHQRHIIANLNRDPRSARP
jgi:hypothetical protein